MDKDHQSQLPPARNKFHVGNGSDQKHYWITPPEMLARLDAEFGFDFDPCPYPLPEGFDGLSCEWGQSNYVNPPFGSIIHEGRKKGPTAWVRKAIAERDRGKRVVLVYPLDKWILMLLRAGAHVRNLGDVRWHAIEDGSQGKGTGRHIACFILDPAVAARDKLIADMLEALKASEREYDNLEDSAPTDPFCGECNMGAGPHKATCAHHLRVAAIAKALGEGR